MAQVYFQGGMQTAVKVALVLGNVEVVAATWYGNRGGLWRASPSGSRLFIFKGGPKAVQETSKQRLIFPVHDS